MDNMTMMIGYPERIKIIKFRETEDKIPIDKIIKKRKARERQNVGPENRVVPARKISPIPLLFNSLNNIFTLKNFNYYSIYGTFQ